MTWTLEATLALTSRNLTHDGYMCTNADQSKIYLVSGQSTRNEHNFIIWEVDTSTWAATNISSSESWSSSSSYACHGIAFYDGNVYIVIEDTVSGDDTLCYVWDGTGTTSWTLSKTLTDYNGSADPTSNPGIGVDSNYLWASTAKGAIPSSADSGVFRLDGAVWTGPYEYSSTAGFPRCGHPYGLQYGAGASIEGADTSVTFVGWTTDKLAHYDSGTGDFEPLGNAKHADLDAFLGGNLTYSIWYKFNGYAVSSDDWGETYNAEGSLQSPYCLVWPLTSILIYGCTGYDDESHIMNTSSASVFSLHDTLPVASNHVIRGFWTDGSTLYCIADNNGGTGCNIYSNTIPSTPAEFYHGLGELVLKTTLPFSGVQPQAMTLKRSLETVVIGSKTPSSDMVAYLDNDYTSYNTMDDGIPTGTSVSAIRWI